MKSLYCAGAVALLSVGSFVAGSAHAEGAFAKELGSDPVALSSKVDLSLGNGNGDGAASGRGPRPYLQALGGPPKRVALVSFYLWDCGNKKENHYNPIYHYRATNDVTQEAIEVFANHLYNASLDGLRATFASFGSQLLTPDEFLDTPEKKAAYADFKLEAGGTAALFNFLQSKADSASTKFVGAPEGYRVLQLTTVGDIKGRHFQLAATGIGVEKLAESLGYDLATRLGVDAVAILYNVIQAERAQISMYGSYLYLFGPNPVPDKGESLYWKGHEYSGVMLRMDVPFVTTTKDGNLIGSDYPGYAVVAQALALKMGEHLKERSRPK